MSLLKEALSSRGGGTEGVRRGGTCFEEAARATTLIALFSQHCSGRDNCGRSTPLREFTDKSKCSRFMRPPSYCEILPVSEFSANMRILNFTRFIISSGMVPEMVL